MDYATIVEVKGIWVKIVENERTAAKKDIDEYDEELVLCLLTSEDKEEK